MVTKKTPEDAERRLLGYERAAAYVGLSIRGFKELAAAGEFVKLPVGARVLFDKVDLDAWIDRKKKAS